MPASITSVVDAPRLVSSDASPTRPECAVTRLSTPAFRAATVNRNPIICADNGTTRSPGSGDEGPVAVGGIGDVGPAQRAYLAAPHPRHEQQSRDHRIDPSALEGDLVRLDTAPASPRPVAGGEHGRQVRDPERPRLPPPPIAGECGRARATGIGE